MGRAVVTPLVAVLLACPLDVGQPSEYDSEPGATAWTTTAATQSNDDDDDDGLPPSWEETGTISDGTTSFDPTCALGCQPDGDNVNVECDIWLQDCPRGQKCTAWANDGGSSWNATRCSPLDPRPRQPGDRCTVEGSGVSGIDDCGIYSMCWNVDGETNEGECVAFCSGTAGAGFCDDPHNACSMTNDGALNLCLPTCDPVLGDCADGEGCYPAGDVIVCVPDAGGETGAHGEPCEFLNVCDPGLWCAPADRVADCQGSIGCCSEFCDLGEPDPDAACIGPGEVCIPWFADGSAPPSLAHLGACLLPRA